MNAMRRLVALYTALMVVYGVRAASITFPIKIGGDIASDGDDGWGYGDGTMPGESDIARFALKWGDYRLGANVTFGSVNAGDAGTFNLDTDGNHTIKASNFYISNHNVPATINGGVLDLALVTSAEATVPARQLAACNQNGVHGATLTLAKGCIVTNASTVRVAYGGYGNKIKITDSSHVYSDSVLLCNNYSSSNNTLEVSSGGVLTVLNGNFRDTGATKNTYLTLADTCNKVLVTGEGSKIACLSSSHKFVIGDTYGGNTLAVSDRGELAVPYLFVLGNSVNANGNFAQFDTGAKFMFGGIRVGENGSCGNVMEVCGNTTTGTCTTVYVGGADGVASGNSLVLSNTSFSCSRVIISSVAGSSSNALYIVGTDTSFTTTVTNVPRYPFVKKGSHNVFEMEGAEWNYFLNMQLDDAASSNTIRFVNGARMNMAGGLFSGTNHIASCGNRVYLGDGAQMSLAFAYISRVDNVFTVSNATLTASDTRDSWNGIKFGHVLSNVDRAGVTGNGLIVQGDAPTVSAMGDIKFSNGSFLRFEVPSGGYAAGHVPIAARNVVWDDASSLDLVLVIPFGMTGRQTLISATGEITVPATVLAAANANLAAQSGGMAKLELANGNKNLVLKVARGIVVSFR